MFAIEHVSFNIFWLPSVVEEYPGYGVYNRYIVFLSLQYVNFLSVDFHHGR